MTSLSERLSALSPAKQALLLRALKSQQHADAAGVSLTRRPTSMQRVPLSFAQQRLWFLDQFDGPVATYNMPIAVKLRGHLNLEALTATIQTIVDRHEVLRTTFDAVDGEPFQKIHPTLVMSLPVTDLSNQEQTLRQRQLTQRMDQEAQTVFDLSTGPLLRVHLIKLSDTEHVLLMTIHHIVCDGWSIGKVLLEEIVELYDAYDQQREASLPTLAVQFGDYCVWQREYLTGQTLERQLNYWTEKLSGLPALLDLPTDRPRPALQSDRGSVYLFELESELLRDLKSFGQARKATLFMTMLGAFSSLLARYARQQDIAVGSPMAGRTHKDLEPLVGFFVNTLVLRSQMTDTMTTNELIEQVRQTCLDAYQHQELPFERLVEALKPERTQSFSPLFQVMFILQNQNQDRGGLKAGDLELESLPIDSKTAMFDLTLKLEEQGDLLLGEFEYNTDLFEQTTIARFVKQFKCLLRSMIESPESAVLQLPLMDGEERLSLVTKLRHDCWEAPNQSLPALIAHQTLQQPNKVAVKCGDAQLTYEELQSRSDALASQLRQSLGHGEHYVGLCLSRGTGMVVAMLACLKSGYAYVPIDPAYPRDRTRLMIERARLGLVLVDEPSLDCLSGIEIEYWLSDQWPTETHQTVTLPVIHPDQLAYVIFTSGSTGTPKGVQIPHAALVNFLLAMRESPGLHATDTLSAVTTISFDIAGLEIYLPLITGATVDIVTRATASDGFLLLEHLKNNQSTVMQATPSTWRMLFATGCQSLPLKRAFCGGEALDADLAHRLTDSGLEVWNLYGPTETTIWSAATPVERANPQALARPNPPIGKAIRATSLYVLDPWLEPSGLGIPGELYIGGHGLARGYFEQADLTADRFIPDPFTPYPGARMYRTGDLVIQREGGDIQYVGRTDFQVKVRGFRIELGEIESALKKHAAVQHAVAMARPHPDGEHKLVAYVQTADNWRTSIKDPQQADGTTEKWQAVWDETYHSSDAQGDDFSGWFSSYTGELIGDEPMVAWADETIRKINQLRPNRVLEIGCGTGLLARRIAPTVEHYVGVDFSATVLQNTHHRLTAAGIHNVTLLASSADQVALQDIGPVDTIVINSVAQYFPSADYLLAVLNRLLPCLSENGCIFLGDLRSLAHLDIQHAAVQAYKADTQVSPPTLLQSIDQAIDGEEELLFDMRWFLASTVDGFERPMFAATTLKDGKYAHEMSQFRYDVVLYADQCPAALQRQSQLPKIDFTQTDQSEDTALAQTLEQLTQDHPQGLIITGLANARTFASAALLSKLRRQSAQGEPNPLIDPDDIRQWALAHGWSAATAWDPIKPKTSFSVVLAPDHGHDMAYLPALLTGMTLPDKEQLVNSPGRANDVNQLVRQLREQLETALPAYMVPSAMVVLDELPLTPNGKIDRAALPEPQAAMQVSDFVAPNTSTERALCDLWSKVLGVEHIGTRQNFFHLGGHSLLAVQVIAKIRDLFGVSLPIQTLFDFSTVQALAAHIDTHQGSVADVITALTSDQRRHGPLTHAQRQLWFIEQLQGSSATYHVSAAANVFGPLNLTALRNSFNDIAQRHEALRTKFVEQAGQPIAVVCPEPNLSFDWQHAHNDADIATALSDAVTEPFDLTTGSLLRVRVLQRSPTHHVLIMVIHHIVADEWSIAVVQQELAALYAAYCTQTTAQLPALALQYGDYAAWQQSQLSAQALAPGLAFWHHLLQDAPALLALPTDHPRPGINRHVGATVAHHIPDEVVGPLRSLAASHGVTLFMALLTGWATLLGRRAHTDDLVIGVPMTDRSRSELEPLVGMFVNTLPVRVDLSGAPDTTTLLKRMGQRVVDAFAHQSTPLEKIIEAVNPPRNLSHAPLFQVVFVMQNAPKAALSFADLCLETRPTDAGISKFDLTLSVEESDNGLDAIVEYNTDLFETSSITAMLEELQTLWRAMAQQPNWPVKALSLLDDAQAQSVLSLPNPPLKHSGAAIDISARFEQQAQATPNQVAVADAHQTLTYKDLTHKVHQLASQLMTFGVEADKVVGIHAEPGVDMVIALLAVLRAGGAYLPMVADTPVERLRRQLELGRACLILDTTGSAAAWPGLTCPTLAVNDLLERPQTQTPLPTLEANDALACLIFTSGSTGEPKGVSLTRRNLSESVAARCAHYAEPMTGLLLLQPFSFDVATGNILWTLCSGGCLYLEPKQTAFEPETLLTRIKQTQVSHLVLLPLLYAPVLSMARAADLKSLRCVIVGGEQMPGELASQHHELVQQANLYNEYGPTETTVMCAAHQLKNDGCKSRPERPPIGKAMGHSRLYVLNELLVPVPVGVTGELYIGGPQVSRGYAQQPAMTAERFIPDPFSKEPGARLYRSGDAAKLRANGLIELVGRADQQVKIRGFRIELGEIETVLSEIEGVEQAVVLAVDRGQSKVLAAYVVTSESSGVDGSTLQAAVALRLPDYMVPTFFVLLDHLPRTSNGKLDIAALPPLPTTQASIAISDLSPNETLLADVWAQVLGVPAVGPEDNFFALGGDSILSIQVVSRARQHGLTFTVKQLFDTQTIRALAAVAQTSQIQATHAIAASTSKPGPIAQWFLTHYGQAPHHFNQSVMLLIDPTCPELSLIAAFRSVCHRHDMLNARFFKEGSQWLLQWAQHTSDETLPYEFIDLSDLEPAQRDHALATHTERLQASLNVFAGRLWCAARLRWGATEPDRLLWVIHHLAVDGVSWRILLNDLEQAVHEHRATGQIHLPPRGTHLSTWLDHLHAKAQSIELLAQANWWQSQIGHTSDSLPLDIEGASQSDNLQSSASTVSVSLPADVSAALVRHLPTRLNAHINDIFLAALAEVVSQWTGQNIVGITLEGHGREDLFEDVDITETVGWFTTTYPICLETSADHDLIEQIRLVKQTRQQVPLNGIGFGLLRYFSSDLELRKALAAGEHQSIGFNYLGQFRQTSSASFVLGQAKESVGQEHRLVGPRAHLIDINGLFSDDCLTFSWTYSTALHHRDTIEKLAQGFALNLQQIATLANDDVDRNPYTPGDFALAQLSQEDADQLYALAGNNVKRAYPLSPTQQGMLFHSELETHSGAYVMQLGCTISDSFDPAAFRQAWQTVLNRHDSLRLQVMPRADADPLQLVLREQDLDWTSLDWCHKSAEQARADWVQWMAQDRQRGFDAYQGSLMRCTLAQTSEDQWYFLWSHHHLLTDGWCLSILLKEVLQIYQAEVDGTHIELDEPIPYQNFIAWLLAQDKSQALTYWQQKLGSFCEPTTLGIDRQTNGTAHLSPFSDGFKSIALQLNEQQTMALTAHVRSLGLTLSLAVQAAWVTLLQRYSGQSDVVFGVTTAGRPPELPDVESMVGVFITTLPVRTQIDRNQTVEALLFDLRDDQLERDPFSHLSLAEIQQASGIDSRRNLFDSLVVFENYPVDEALANEPGTLAIHGVEFAEQTNYALTLTVQPGACTRLHLAWSEARFDQTAIEPLLRGFLALLQSLPESSRQTVDQWARAAFDVQALAWQREELHAPAHAQASNNSALGLLSQFERQLTDQPGAPALTCDDTTLSYAELEQRKQALVQTLARHGVQRGDRVAILLPRDLNLLPSLLAIMHLGAAYVPIDPTYPAARVQAMLEDCGAVLCLTDQTSDSLPIKLPTVDPASAVLDPSIPTPAVAARAQDVAYVIYTSGSTGKPKGVQVTHANLSNFLTAMAKRPGMSASQCLLAVTTISFDIAGLELYLPLWTGGHIVLAPRMVALDGALLAKWLEQHQIDIMQATPTTWRLLIESGWQAKHLQQAWCGGEILHGDLAAQLVGLGVELWNLYGPTETTIWSTVQPVTAANVQQSAHIPIGSAIDNTWLYIVDEHGNPVPFGMPGELLIGGHGVARGYLNRPALTAERFVPDTFGHQTGCYLYRTGDRVWMDPQRRLHCLGRLDFQIKIRGFRIEPGEIESVIRRHPEVAQCVVTVWERASDDQRLVAYVVSRHRATALDSIGQWLSEQLPAHMVPVDWIALSSLPLTPNNKIDRKALPTPDSIGPLAQPDDGFKQQNSPARKPATETEHAIATMFEQVLGQADVNATDDFFDLGGHSLLAGRLVSRLTNQWGIELPIATLFEYSTVQRLAEHLDNLRWATGAMTPESVNEAHHTDAPDASDDAEHEEFRL